MPGTGHEQDEPKSSDKLTVLNEGEDNVGKVLECIYQHTDAKDAHHNAWFDMLCDKIALPMSNADIEALKALLRTKGNLTLEDIRVIKECYSYLSSPCWESIFCERFPYGENSRTRKESLYPCSTAFVNQSFAFVASLSTP